VTTPHAFGCRCIPAWPGLTVELDNGTTVPVEPAATPGGLACLYYAQCIGCGSVYPHPFRVIPRLRTA
jgi:hypothetical protein